MIKKYGGMIIFALVMWIILDNPLSARADNPITDNFIVTTYLEEISDTSNDYFNPQVTVCHKWLMIIPSCATLTYQQNLFLDGMNYCGFIEDGYNFCVYLSDIFNNCDPKSQPQGLIKVKVDCVKVPLGPSPPPYCEGQISPVSVIFDVKSPPSDSANDFYHPAIMVQLRSDPSVNLVLTALPDTTDSLVVAGETYSFKTRLEKENICIDEVSPNQISIGCIRRVGFMPNITVAPVDMSRSQPQIKVSFQGDPANQSVTLAASQTKSLYGVEFTAIRYTRQNKLCVYGYGTTNTPLYVAYIKDSAGNSPGPIIRPYDPNNPADQALYAHANATQEVRPYSSLEQGYCIDLPPALMCESTVSLNVNASSENGISVASVPTDSQIQVKNVVGEICISSSECTQDGDWTRATGRNTWLDYKIGTGGWTHPLASEVASNVATFGGGAATGNLVLRVNDTAGQYSDNTGSYHVDVSITAPYPGVDTCPAGTTPVQ